MDATTTLPLLAGLLGLGVTILMPGLRTQRPAARAAARLKTVMSRLDQAASTQERKERRARLFLDEAQGLAARLRRRLAEETDRLGGKSKVGILGGGTALAAAVLTYGVHRMDPWGPALNPLLVIAGTLIAGLVLYAQLRRRWQIAFLSSFADAIDLVVRAVRSGIPVSEAIRVAGQEVDDPVRSQFRAISDGLDLGIDLKDAMRDAAERVRLPDFYFLVTAMVIQRESGGQLAETLEGLSTILRRRKELRLKIKAMTAEGRMSAAIVGAIPIVAAVAMYVLDPGHIERLFVPGGGRTMLYIGLGCLCGGITVIHFLTRVKP